MKQITPPRRAGLFNKNAPHWTGRTAAALIAERRAQYLRDAEQRRLTRGRRGTSTRPPLSPQRQLTRLHRALARRKTLEGRQRVQQRIAELEQQL